MNSASKLQWSELTSLIDQLHNDNNLKMELIIASASIFGLRISEVKLLTRRMIESRDFKITVSKSKGKKIRSLRAPDNYMKIYHRCEAYWKNKRLDDPLFPSSRQFYHEELQKIKEKYGIEVDVFSSHSFRKTMGYRIYELGGKSEDALIRLSILFNHQSTMTTRRYLSINTPEQLYGELDF